MNRILWNRRGEDIDEIVLTEVHSVHVEQMDDRCWWICIRLGDGANVDPYWMGNFVADSRGRMRFVEQESDGIVWDRDEEHDR